MFLLVGLGNPGNQYDKTRHNVGFDAIDVIAGDDLRPNKLGGVTKSLSVGGTRCIALKPMEFMNRSGFALQRTAKFHAITDWNRVVVIHDELDLDPGMVRVKVGGGHGGHNGLRSIIEQLGSPDFVRVRIGIGRPPVKGQEVASWVLGHFPPDARGKVNDAIKTAAEMTESIVRNGVQNTMNKFHQK